MRIQIGKREDLTLDALPKLPLFGAHFYAAVTHFDFNYIGETNAWTAIRTAIDGVGDLRAFHSHQLGGDNNEDDHLHVHRASILAPGLHVVEGQWGQGHLKVWNDASSKEYFTRRLGVLAVPMGP